MEPHAGAGEGDGDGFEAGVETCGCPAECLAEAAGGDVLVDAEEERDDVDGVFGWGSGHGGCPV
jgi:hypothetical protein